MGNIQQTEEQRRNAIEGANIPIGVEPITSDNLTPVPTIEVETPPALPVPDVSVLSSKIFETPSGAEVTGEGELVTPPPTDFTSQLDTLIGDVESRDRESDIVAKTQVQQRKLIEINKRIALSTAQSLEREEAALASGETLGFASLEATKERRTSAIEAIKLSAIKSAIVGELSLATQLADRAIDQEFSQQEQDIQTARNNIIANFDTFTAEEKKQAQTTLERLNADDTFLKSRKETQKNIDTEALLAAELGGTNAQIEDIRNSANQVVARQKRVAAGLVKEDVTKKQFVPATKTQPAGFADLVEGTFTPIVSNLNDIGNEVGIPNAEFGTPEHTSQTILNSSQFGDTRLIGAQLEKVQQTMTALGGIETLNALLFKGRDGIDLTGPVKGRVRNLVKSLGGDANAAAINATIQGLIPTVARGIFGEVGVLTDTDINNYKKTIANITGSEDQNKVVSVIMLDVLSRTLESTLITNAQNQTNVSGFAETYLNIRKRVEQEKLKLGVTSFSGLENEDFLDAIPADEAGGFGPDQFNTLFSSFMNQ